MANLRSSQLRRPSARRSRPGCPLAIVGLERRVLLSIDILHAVRIVMRYLERSVNLVRLALELAPAEQRSALLRETIMIDPTLLPILKAVENRLRGSNSSSSHWRNSRQPPADRRAFEPTSVESRLILACLSPAGIAVRPTSKKPRQAALVARRTRIHRAGRGRRVCACVDIAGRWLTWSRIAGSRGSWSRMAERRTSCTTTSTRYGKGTSATDRDGPRKIRSTAQLDAAYGGTWKEQTVRQNCPLHGPSCGHDDPDLCCRWPLWNCGLEYELVVEGRDFKVLRAYLRKRISIRSLISKHATYVRVSKYECMVT